LTAYESKETMPKPRVIYWFRTDLRLHDSPALHAALGLKPEVVYPIWCWDSHYVYHARVGVNRWHFLLDCMNDVSEGITKLNKNNKLFVLREPAVTLLPKLWKAWNITHLVFEKDTDAYGRQRDEEVKRMAKEAGVEVITKSGRTLWDSDEIVKKNGGKPTMTAAQVTAAGAKVGEIARPLDAPTSLPDPGELHLDQLEQKQPEPKPDINAHHRAEEEKSYAAGLAGPNGDFAPPAFEELGLKAATTTIRGGETVILKRLEERIFSDEDYIATFAKPNTSPAAFEPQSTLLTSPYLHFGALSCRYLYHRTLDIVEKRKKERKPVSEPPTSMTGQLYFRDMYFAAQAALGWSFGQTYNNSHCRFIPWHLPSKVDTKTKLITGGYEVDDPVKEVEFQRWAHGRTGFPWIDAIMRQLRTEGWIHHLARHSVACFLTRGGCYISWERGAEVFEELLVDHEAACNIGNWQWLSCTAFFAQFYRCYSPVAFGKKWDPEGDYVRKYVPELANMPKKYIYEPHKAPIADQKKAGVKIDGDGSQEEKDGLKLYPKPMFDFNTQRDICLTGMKNAYHVGLYGNDPKVMDGSWKKMFDDSAEGPTSGSKGGPGGLDTWDDADGGTEDVVHDEAPTPKKAAPRKAGKDKPTPNDASPRVTRGPKREASQGTLDGAFKKKAK
jgi:cryptochrome